MTDYISREAAKECIHKWLSDIFGIDKLELTVLNKRLNAIPAADVAPVRHGRWIEARGSWFTPGGDPVWECSECGKGMHVYGIEHGTYGSDVADGQWVACPNCGARMDGEEPPKEE